MFKAVTVNYRSPDLVSGLAEDLFLRCGCEELVVVNHASPDSLEDLCSRFPIRVVNQANRGYGAGLNRGLRELGDWSGTVLLCNPDVLTVNPDAVPDAIRYLSANPDIACLLPALVGSDGSARKSYRHFYTIKTLVGSRLFNRDHVPGFMQKHFYLDRDAGRPMDVDWGCGAAMLVRTPVFPNTVSFDERFFLYFEDVDACLQTWRSGYRVVYYPALSFRHLEAADSRRKALFLTWHIVSALKFALKYRGFPARESVGMFGRSVERLA